MESCDLKASKNEVIMTTLMVSACSDKKLRTEMLKLDDGWAKEPELINLFQAYEARAGNLEEEEEEARAAYDKSKPWAKKEGKKPEGQRKMPPGMKCHRCGREHFVADCRVPTSVKCRICNNNGHTTNSGSIWCKKKNDRAKKPADETEK